MSIRIEPAVAPFAPAVATVLERAMPPGMPPLTLFTVLARDERLFGKFAAGSLLDRGNLPLRDREIVIHRTTARCGCEYEFGIHVTLFAARAKFDEADVAALAAEDPAAGAWAPHERDLIALCDGLHAACDVDDALWTRLREHYSVEALLEAFMLAGFYRTVAYVAKGARLPLESFAARFPGGAAGPA